MVDVAHANLGRESLSEIEDGSWSERDGLEAPAARQDTLNDEDIEWRGSRACQRTRVKIFCLMEKAVDARRSRGWKRDLAVDR